MNGKIFLHKDKLIYEALREFAEKGFDSSSLNQIIKRSGISKGSFYHHFNNKEELFYSVIHRAAQEKLTFIDRWIHEQEIGEKPRSFFETMRLQMEGGIQFALQYPELSVFLMSIMKDPQLRDKALGLSPQYYDQVFDSLVEEALQRGELRKDIDPGFMKKFLKHSLINMGELLLNDSGEQLEREQLEKQTQQILKLLQHGLGTSVAE